MEIFLAIRLVYRYPTTITNLKIKIKINIKGKKYPQSMEVDQFISTKKAGIKARKRRQRSHYQVCSPRDKQEAKQAEDGNIVLKRFINYFRYVIFVAFAWVY